MNMKISILLVGMGLFFASCDNGTGPSDDSLDKPNDELISLQGKYWFSGDTLFVEAEQQADTNKYCEGEKLVTEITPPGVDTTKSLLSIKEDTLIISDLDEETDGNNLAQTKWERISGSSGYQGRWKIIYDFPDTNFTFTPDQQKIINKIQLEFTNSSVTVYGLSDFNISFQPLGWQIGWFFSGWAYDIELAGSNKVVAPTQKTLYGRKTGETVTISWDGLGNATYSIDVEGKADHIVASNPESCPNDPPEWYQEFLENNRL